MKYAIYYYTEKGKGIANFLKHYCQEYSCRVVLRNNNKEIESDFQNAKAIIFISACGIAVRTIAPYVKDKFTDPAVVCMDDNANNIISLLSGHIGQANKLTKKLAKTLNSNAIITTATDINNRFSVDEWAKDNNLIISNRKIAKLISAKILENDIGFYSNFPVDGKLPNGLISKSNGEYGIVINDYETDIFDITLTLLPRNLVVGIGCRKDKTKIEIEEVVTNAFFEAQLDIRRISNIVSIDIKSKEKGLLEYAKSIQAPINFFSASTLKKAIGKFTDSDFVQSTVGVGNVCERCVSIATDKNILTKKFAMNGVTVAIGETNWRGEF